MIGAKRQLKVAAENDCNVPWAMLIDPTSACNLHCTGCWAAEYGNKLNMTLEALDDIICQGKKTGTFMYIYSCLLYTSSHHRQLSLLGKSPMYYSRSKVSLLMQLYALRPRLSTVFEKNFRGGQAPCFSRFAGVF